MTHYYAFSTREDDPIPTYERTFGTEDSAWRWVDARPTERFFTEGLLPERYWY